MLWECFTRIGFGSWIEPIEIDAGKLKREHQNNALMSVFNTGKSSQDFFCKEKNGKN